MSRDEVAKLRTAWEAALLAATEAERGEAHWKKQAYLAQKDYEQLFMQAAELQQRLGEAEKKYKDLRTEHTDMMRMWMEETQARNAAPAALIGGYPEWLTEDEARRCYDVFGRRRAWEAWIRMEVESAVEIARMAPCTDAMARSAVYAAVRGILTFIPSDPCTSPPRTASPSSGGEE